MGIVKIRTSPYRPACNGMLERYHRTLNSMIDTIVSENQRDWDTRVPFVMAAYRSSVLDATGFTPNFPAFGREVRAPLISFWAHQRKRWNFGRVNDFVADQQERLRCAYSAIRESLRRCAVRRKKTYDLKIRKQDIRVGTYYPRRWTVRSPKWTRNYVGPMLETKVLSPTNVCIQKSHRANPQVVHIDKLKPCRGVTPVSWLGSEQEPSDGDGSEEDSSPPAGLGRPDSCTGRSALPRISASCISGI